MQEKMSQKEAVYQITMKVIKENNLTIDGTSIVDVLDSDMRSSIISEFITGIKDGTISLNKEYDDKTLKKFVQSAIGNWHRKDTRLNGGSEYQPKNPGSNLGMSDNTIKNLNIMAKELQDTEYEGDILKEIYFRVNKLKKKHRKNIISKIDINMIPESLRHLL